MSTRTVTPALNPFPGLRPFREEEEYLFFGRERQVDSMINKLAATRFLVVVGTSGSGKSSLVNCGLRPALHRGLMASAGTAWRMAQFRPGGNPIKAMSRAVGRDGVLRGGSKSDGLTVEEIFDTTLRLSKLGLIDVYEQAHLDRDINLLLVVDQFEELFRYRNLGASGAGEEAQAFVNLLLEVCQEKRYPIYVVLTMRSDFLGDCAQIHGLPEAINQGQYLVPRMTRDERRSAISGPVGIGGAEIDPVLLTRLVNDVGDNPDQLSILQHALNRTWAHWQNEGGGKGPISLEHYEAIGTMAHALDQHAEKPYAELGSEEKRKLCAKIFKALTDKGTDPRGIRRPLKLGTLSDLADASEWEVREVIEAFRNPSRSFLMPPVPEVIETETVIDISHESLMRVWERLKRWADEEVESVRMYRRLAESAMLHAEGKAGLWRDPDLQLALDWRDREKPTASWAELYGEGYGEGMIFLAYSEALRDKEAREEAERKQRELEQARALEEARRKARNLRISMLIAALLMIVIIVGYLAISNHLEARRQYNIAVSSKRATAALLNRDARLDLASLLSIEAWNAAQTFETSNVLFTTVRSNPRLQNYLHHDGEVRSVAISPDGGILAAGSNGGSVALWDVGSGKRLRELLKGGVSNVRGVAFSPDGRILASASNDGTVRLWDAVSGRPQGNPLTGNKGVTSIALGAGGKILAAGSEDRTIRLWDLTSGQPLGDPMRGHGGEVTSIAFDTDGQILASGSKDGTVLLWYPMCGGLVLDNPLLGEPLKGHKSAVTSVAFSPDGKTVASGSEDKTLMLWDVASGQPRGEALRGHGGAVTSVAFSADGRLVASGSNDGSVRLWEAAGGRAWQDPLLGHSTGVTSLAFSRNGRHLVSGSVDKTVLLWDLTSTDLLGRELSGLGSSVTCVAISPDGKVAASGSDDGNIQLWDVAGGRPRGEPLRGHGAGVISVAFNPDGRILASASADKTLLLWDVTEMRPQGRQLGAPGGGVTGIAFSPDGRLLASGSDNGTVQLYDVASRQPRGQSIESRGSGVTSIAFSSDGRTLASGSSDATVRLWDVGSRKQRGEPIAGQGGGSIWSVAFSLDSKTLVTGSNDGTVRLWDVATQQLLGSLKGHADSVTSVAMSSRMLVSGSGDGLVRLWDVESGQPLGDALIGDGSRVAAVALGAEGKILASASEKSIWIWDVGVDSWISLACRRANRNLTEEEWTNYMGRDVPFRRTCEQILGPR